MNKMKALKAITLAALFYLPALFAGAQTNPLKSLYDKYQGKEGYYFLELNTNMLNIAKESDREKGNFGNMVNLLIVSCEGETAGKGMPEALYKEFHQNFNPDEYKGLVEVKSKGENVEFLVKQESDGLSGVIILVKEKDETTLISASGNFDLKDLARFSGMEQCKGLEVLGKMCEE